MTAKCQCSQCGGTDFKKEGTEFLRCAYCNSLFRMLPPEEEKKSKVIIEGGANVVFGENSKVTIQGGLLVKKGANVQFLGRLDIVEKSSDEKIKEARELLTLQKDQ